MFEIVAIGDEILRGAVINENATFISQSLSKMGWQVDRHTALPDKAPLLIEGLRAALERSQVVIATGGLGPTCDDLTRQAAATLFGASMHYDETVASDLKKRFGESLVSLKDQATIPTSATPLLNQVGTAPGLIFDMGNKHLILLPGVLLEMQKMLIDQVIPYLQKVVLKGSDVYTETVHFCSLTESQLDPLLREFKQSSQDIQIGIYPRPGVVNVCFTAKKKEVLAPLVSKIKHAYPTHFFESKSGNIEEAIHAWMINQKKTLALAESCTGGSIASHLTLLDGASGYFLGSLVVYSNALKQSLLGVSKKTLQSKGAVSPEVVKEMLEGLFSATPADYGIAISGIAGKAGGTPETPIGTIWIAFGERGKPATVFTYLARGSREMIILSAANRALSALWQYLAYGVK